MNTNKTIQLAFEHHRQGNLSQAEQLYEKILKKQPDNGAVLHMLGVIHSEHGNYQLAIKYIKKVLQLNSANYHAYYNLGNAFRLNGQSEKAINSYRKVIHIDPYFVDAYHNLGIVLQDRGQLDEAVACYQKAIQLNPNFYNAYYNLGNIFKAKGQPDEAIACYQKTIELNPNIAETYCNLGIVLQAKGRPDEAIACYQKTIELNPNIAETYCNLGNVLQAKGQPDEAIACYQKALQLKPDISLAYNNQGVALQWKGRFNEAITCYQKAIELNPNYADAYNNLGNVFTDIGQLNEAETYFKRALQINPDCSTAYSNLLFIMNYNSCHNPQDILSEHLLFAKKFAEPLYSAISPHTNERQPNKTLRIGYCSPDFRGHSVAYFIEPVLEAHNREHFEIFCYSLVPIQDEVTKRIKKYADQWRSIVGMSDENAAKLVRNDRIDILVDLAGHTGKNRMLLFARKPAPIQVSWIGYPATTGLSTMDYKIVDSYTDPLGMTDQFYTEKLIHIPGSFLCYQPHKESPDIGLLPALSEGYITFGSFNAFAKISSEVLSLWISILNATSNSHMIIKAKGLSDRKTCQSIMDIFMRNGIASERLELIPPNPSTVEHLNLYNRIDIGLDTFPYDGTTTTCEAMWMGVPVVTLAGKTHASRVGVSLLSNVGLKELIAKTPDGYIETAVNLAKDLKRLQSLRLSLRDMMKHSPLCDAKRFTADLEIYYHQIWETWCKSI